MARLQQMHGVARALCGAARGCIAQQGRVASTHGVHMTPGQTMSAGIPLAHVLLSQIALINLLYILIFNKK